MKYKTFEIWASFDGSSAVFFEFLAVDFDSAMQDIYDAYGDFDLIRWGSWE